MKSKKIKRTFPELEALYKDEPSAAGPNASEGHTPTPWKVDRWHDKANGSKGISIISSNTHAVANMVMQIQDNELANAAFIVRAVNSHEELLEACRKASALVNYYRRAVMTGQIVETHPGALVKGDYDVMEALDKAIAKAEGK